jgi:hypothetical protein
MKYLLAFLLLILLGSIYLSKHKFVQLMFWPTFRFGVATPLCPKTAPQLKRIWQRR